MQPQDVTRVLSDPLAQELMQSSIPARLAYLGPDDFRARSRLVSTGTVVSLCFVRFRTRPKCRL